MSDLLSDSAAPRDLVLADFPISCAEVLAVRPGAPDGPYTLYIGHDANRPWPAYCAMKNKPQEYLAVPPAGNFAQYTAGGYSPGTDVRTRYSRIRIDPIRLTVDADDETFSMSVGKLLHNGMVPVTSMPFASAMSCAGAGVDDGLAEIDLRGTPFAVPPNVFWTGGTNPAGDITYAANNQLVDLKGSGACGWIGPQNANGPFNAAGGGFLPLVYVP